MHIASSFHEEEERIRKRRKRWNKRKRAERKIENAEQPKITEKTENILEKIPSVPLFSVAPHSSLISLHLHRQKGEHCPSQLLSFSPPLPARVLSLRIYSLCYLGIAPIRATGSARSSPGGRVESLWPSNSSSLAPGAPA